VVTRVVINWFKSYNDFISLCVPVVNQFKSDQVDTVLCNIDFVLWDIFQRSVSEVGNVALGVVVIRGIVEWVSSWGCTISVSDCECDFNHSFDVLVGVGREFIVDSEFARTISGEGLVVNSNGLEVPNVVVLALHSVGRALLVVTLLGWLLTIFEGCVRASLLIFSPFVGESQAFQAVGYANWIAGFSLVVSIVNLAESLA
jgi:hypothetical protein